MNGHIDRSLKENDLCENLLDFSNFSNRLALRQYVNAFPLFNAASISVPPATQRNSMTYSENCSLTAKNSTEKRIKRYKQF